MPAVAQEEIVVNYERVNPNDAYKYKFKRLREKITLLVLSPSPNHKADYYEKLLNVRLAELKYVVDNKDAANIETSSGRYSATAGQLTEYIINKNLDEHKQKTADIMSSHLPVLEKLKESFDATTAVWRFIEYDVDYL